MPKKAPEIVSRIETITPADAARWLGSNTHNRKLRENMLRRFVTAMNRGEWELNGESIKFDWHGVLIDGQHRLAAVVESGKTIKSLVIHNLPPAAQETVDTGARRTPGDILGLRGYANGTTLAAAARYLAIIEKGLLKRTSGGVASGEGIGELSPQDILLVVARYPALVDAIPATNGTIYIGASHSQMAALYTWLSQIDTADAATFFEQLSTGLGLTEGAPTYVLRRWFEHAKTAPTSHRRQLNRVIVHGMVVKAWNAFRRGETVKRLYYDTTDDLPRPI